MSDCQSAIGITISATNATRHSGLAELARAEARAATAGLRPKRVGARLKGPLGRHASSWTSDGIAAVLHSSAARTGNATDALTARRHPTWSRRLCHPSACPRGSREQPSHASLNCESIMAKAIVCRRQSTNTRQRQHINKGLKVHQTSSLTTHKQAILGFEKLRTTLGQLARIEVKILVVNGGNKVA